MSGLSIFEAGHLAYRLFLAGRSDQARAYCQHLLAAVPDCAEALDLVALMDAPAPELLDQAEASGSPDRQRAARMWRESMGLLNHLRTGYWVSYASNDEDILLNRVFRGKDEGFYVDVGANHPTLDSVTQHFYLKGWKGINIEPSQPFYDTLVAFRGRDVNLAVAVGEQPDTLPFYDLRNSGLSSLSEERGQEFMQNGFVDKRSIPVRTLADICAEHAPERIDFLKIDVEGWELPVIRGNDWTRYRPVALVVEALHPGTLEPSWEEWEKILLRHDYLFAWFDGFNRYYIRAEDRDLLECFHQVPRGGDRALRYREVRKASHACLLARTILNSASPDSPPGR